MAKIKLGKRPENFAPVPVTFPMPDGTEGVVNVTYKYRTRKEFGAYIDELIAQATDSAQAEVKAEIAAHADAVAAATAAPEGEAKPIPEIKAFSMMELMAKTSGSNADHLLGAVSSWDMGEPLKHETFEQLSDELPAGAIAMISAYRKLCQEGRLGN